MHLAAAFGFTESAGRMISNSVAPNVPNDRGETPIQLAAMNNWLQMVQLLMASSGNSNSHDNWGWTPIHEASAEGHTEVVKVLMKCTDDPNAPDKDGQTPYEVAQDFNHFDIMNLLISKRAYYFNKYFSKKLTISAPIAVSNAKDIFDRKKRPIEESYRRNPTEESFSNSSSISK